MIEILLSTALYAADLPGEEIFSAPQVQETNIKPAEKVQLLVPKSKQTVMQYGPGNLPGEYLLPQGRQSTISELITPPKGSVEVFRALKVGDSLDLKVSHSVIAFPDEKAPVIATAESGSLRGLKFIGESYLEKNSKRIFVDFTRVVQGDRIFKLKGVGVSSQGQPGLTGEYHSREAEYFAGDFISSMVAGYFDGLVPRHSNAFGQIETDTSVDSAVKKGLASGALSTADRFREKLKKVPEFSEIKGPFEIKLLILDQAKSTN